MIPSAPGVDVGGNKNKFGYDLGKSLLKLHPIPQDRTQYRRTDARTQSKSRHADKCPAGVTA